MKFALFNDRKSTVSKLIRWFSWCGTNGYSHAAFVFDDGVVYESKEFIGVRRIEAIHLTMEKGETYTIFEVQTTPHQDRLLREWLDLIVDVRNGGKAFYGRGWGYDYWGILGFIFHWKERKQKKVFCSALVKLGLEKVGVDLFPGLPHWKVCPDLLSHCPIAHPHGGGYL